MGREKSIFGLIMVVISIIIACSAVDCSGAEPMGDTGLEWSFEDGVLTIEGSGAMPDYTYGSVPWNSVINQITSIELPDGLTRIGAYAFKGCGFIVEIDIPASVEEIGVCAFQSCGLLETVNITSPIAIRDNAFQQCTSLNEMDFSLITEIGEGASKNVYHLKKLNLI